MKKLQESLLGNERNMIDNESAAEQYLNNLIMKWIDKMMDHPIDKTYCDRIGNKLKVGDLVIIYEWPIFGIIIDFNDKGNKCYIASDSESFENKDGDVYDCKDIFLVKDKKYFLNKFVK